jgi:phospho-N-acetylmuramoyl-pentapeptide-transferase
MVEPVQGIFDFLPYGNTLSKMILYFLGTAAVAFIFSPFIINVLYKLGIQRKARADVTGNLDKQDGKLGTPIMGGFIIVIATTIVTLLFNWNQEFTYIPIAALVLSSCIGGIDDLLNIFGDDRDEPRRLNEHLKLIFKHPSYLKKLFYLITIPWAVLKGVMAALGSVSSRGLHPHEKTVVQVFIGATVGLWIYRRVGWSDIWLPYILQVEFIRNFFEVLPGISVNMARSSIDVGWLMVPFITLTIMTVSNAVNITDGMDGLAAGLTVMAFAAYAVVAFGFSQSAGSEGYRHLAYLCSTVSGASLAYLYFNVKPARVQMGDVGSLGIGTLLSVVAIILHKEFTLLFIAGMFLIDGTFSVLIQILSVKIRKKRVFKMSPIHYHFKLLGWSEEKVVMRFWIVSMLLTGIGIWLTTVNFAK